MHMFPLFAIVYKPGLIAWLLTSFSNYFTIIATIVVTIQYIPIQRVDINAVYPEAIISQR